MQISNQNIKAFAKRFRYQRKGRTGLVPISVEQAKQAINNFITLNGVNNLKPSFVETRIKLLKICLEEKTATKRWGKVRGYLLERLESQVLSVYITQSDLQDDEVKPFHIMSYLMDPNSFMCQSIKAVVLFNLNDNRVKLPNDLLLDFGSAFEYSFPFYRLYRNKILLTAKTDGGEFIEKELPYNENNAVLTINRAGPDNKISWTYSLLQREKSKSYYIIFHDDFYRLFRKLHKNIVARYNLDNSKNPSYWFSKLFDPMNNHSSKERQKKILKELTGQYIMAWNWKKEGKTIYDISKTAKIYFPEVKEKIVSIKPIYPIPWEPGNFLFNENTLRYELIEQYLKRFKFDEMGQHLIEKIEDISIFNLESFRNMVDKWQKDKDITKIILMLRTFLSHYSKYERSSKERRKIIQYVKISTYIQQGKKCKDAYMLTSPSEKVKTVEKRYQRQKKKLREEGYNVDDPQHLVKIKREWNISEADLIL